VYKIAFSIEQVDYKYAFSLDTVTCLKQNRWFSPDPLYAEVEFNHSAHNVTVQPTNRYSLGYFQQHDQSFAYSSHHRMLQFICTHTIVSFMTMSPFLISYRTKRFYEMLLQTWTFGIHKQDLDQEDISLEIDGKTDILEFGLSDRVIC
jgi:hypothetical protein